MTLTTAHCQNVSNWVAPYLSDIGSGWVKIVNPSPTDFGRFAQKGLCRCWSDDIDAQYISQGRAGGKAFVDRMFPRWQAIGATANELANEPDCNTNAGLINLREYTLGAIEEAAHLGIKLCILNLAEANPHDNNQNDPAVSAWKLQQLRPAAQAAAAGGHYFGRHVYWRPGAEGPTGRWHALGRLGWDLEQLNVPNLITLVNEFGIDGGIAGNPGQQGWQVLTTESLYRGEIIEAERYARTLPGVEALMYFDFGAQEPWLSGGFDHPEAFARSLVAPLKALDVAAQTPEDASGHLRIELCRPLAYTAQTNVVTQRFGSRAVDYSAYGLVGHQGIDYRAPLGTPVLAMHPGIARIYDQGTVGLGKYVKVQYYDGRNVLRYTTRLAHLSAFKVADGQRVARGQVVGLSGSSGNSTAAHLHADLRIEGGVNPGYADCVDFAPFRTA